MANEYVKDLFYVDYCNNCKDLDIMSPLEVPCNHPFYCWHDKGEVQELEGRIGAINENERVRGFLYAYEKEELYKLKQRKFELVKEKLREYRRKR